MPAIPITDAAKFISGVYTRPYLVKNSSTVTVYLGQDSSLTVATRAFSLPAGSSLNWNGDTELWGITDAGKLGEIELLYTGENSFSPGPPTTSILNNVGIASLPVMIGQASGAAPVGAYSAYLPGATTGRLDVSTFGSVLLDLSCAMTGYTPNGTDLIQLYVEEYDSATGPVTKTHYAIFNLGLINPVLTGPSYYQFPVNNAFIRVLIYVAKAATGTAATIVASAYGIASRSERKYSNGCANLCGQLAQGGVYNRLTQAITEFIQSTDRPLTISAQKLTGSNGFVNVNMADIFVSQFITALTTTAAQTNGDTTNAQFTPPFRPLQIQLSTSAAPGMNVGITG